MHTQLTGMNIDALMQQTMAAAMVAATADPASAHAVTPPDAVGEASGTKADPPAQTQTTAIDLRL